MPDKGRRDALKTLATVPVLGALAYGVYKTRKNALQSRKMVSRSVWVSSASVSVANN